MSNDNEISNIVENFIAASKSLRNFYGIDYSNTANSLLLGVATEGQKNDLAQELLHLGLSPHPSNTPDILNTAVRSGHIDTIRAFANVGVDLNHFGGNERQRPLHVAAQEGNAEVIKVLVELGADVCADENIPLEFSSLELAITGGHINALRCLVEGGANINRQLSSGSSCMVTTAIRTGNVCVLRAVLALGGNTVDFGNREQSSPLLTGAARDGHGDMVRELCQLGVPINALETMAAAAREGHASIIKQLVDDGVNVGGFVNVETAEGYTPLLLAVKGGHGRAMHELINLGGDINASLTRNISKPGRCYHYSYHLSGDTALHVAAQEGHSSLIPSIVRCGGLVNAENICGDTPIHLAVRYKKGKCVRALAQWGADVNVQNNSGTTPLFAAVQLDDKSMVRKLISLGADIDICNGFNHSPISYISRVDGSKLSTFLILMGADVTKVMTTDATHKNERLCRRIDKICDKVCSSIIDSPERYMLSSLAMLMKYQLDISTFKLSAAKYEIRTTIVNTFHTNCKFFHHLDRIHAHSYPLKHRYICLAANVFYTSLQLDGERINLATKIHRYVELVCLFSDKAMLTDLVALRLTCKANSVHRRFPVCHSQYQELEVNLIESFLAHDVSRFVLTSQIQVVLALLCR
jgi:ankyrin repeat protein